MGKQEDISWVEPWETFWQRVRPALVTIYRGMLPALPAFVFYYGLVLLFLSRLQKLQPAFEPDYFRITLGVCYLLLFFGLLPLSIFTTRPISVGPAALRIGMSATQYERIESIRVDTSGARPMLVVQRRKGPSAYGIAGDVDVARIETYLREHAQSKLRPQSPLRRRDLSLNWLALFLGACAALGLLALAGSSAGVREVLGKETVRWIVAIGMTSSVTGGGLGLWTLFRTRHVLVIPASLAAIAAMVLDWLYVFEPTLR